MPLVNPRPALTVVINRGTEELEDKEILKKTKKTSEMFTKNMLRVEIPEEFVDSPECKDEGVEDEVVKKRRIRQRLQKLSTERC